jgi:phage terminase large subunit
VTGSRVNRERIKKAIPGSGGLIAVIAESCKYSWATVRDFIRNDPELALMLRDEEEKIDDAAEKTVINKILSGDEQSAKWWLARRRRSKFGDNLPPVSEPPSKVDIQGISADLLAPDFLGAYRDLRAGKHTEYLFFGGRGSTKSSAISLFIIDILRRYPNMHALALRQVKDTIRDSVYTQLVWAIGELGLSDDFKCTTNPLEIEYLPTHQKIYFRGADDPGKIKSIKPAFGYIGIVWFEELDQFRGSEAVRKIEQSAIRGGDLAFIFKSWNPPKTASNWANKYKDIPNDSQFKHASNYLNVPPEWLGKAFIERADHLRKVNPVAFDHEYMGIPNGSGGKVFDNVTLRKITDDEIKGWERIHIGLDWGFFPDPLSVGWMYYDPVNLKLYIFKEYRAYKKRNKKVYNELVLMGLRKNDLIIADSAEPKSIADFKEYGAYIRGAEKGPDTLDYSMKWLQSLTEIVIDPERAPYHAQEFSEYELEQGKDGEFISEYPDKNNHAIDDSRYATNLIWRVRGE